MAEWPPAGVGMSLQEVDTPALLIDLDALQRNLHRMAEAVADFPGHLRPHAKTHKSPVIAGMQIKVGAKGVCCRTVGEAETMVQAGIADVFITNQRMPTTAATFRRTAIR